MTERHPVRPWPTWIPRLSPLSRQDFDSPVSTSSVNTHLHSTPAAATSVCRQADLRPAPRAETRGARYDIHDSRVGRGAGARYVPVDAISIWFITTDSDCAPPGHTRGTQVVVVETGGRGPSSSPRRGCLVRRARRPTDGRAALVAWRSTRAGLARARARSWLPRLMVPEIPHPAAGINSAAGNNFRWRPPSRAPRFARPHEGFDLQHRQRATQSSAPPVGGHDQTRARGSAAPRPSSSTGTDRGPGPDAGAASRPSSRIADNGFRRRAGHLQQRRGLPHGDRRSDAMTGSNPHGRRRVGRAGLFIYSRSVCAQQRRRAASARSSGTPPPAYNSMTIPQLERRPGALARRMEAPED